MLRFYQSDSLPKAFLDDWLRVAADEARHLGMVLDRLEAHGFSYGCMPAHASLWYVSSYPC